VDFSSAQQLAGNNAYTVQDADHMEVCKPPNKEHPSYEFLLRLIITCRKVSFNNLVCSEFHNMEAYLLINDNRTFIRRQATISFF
jgi:hypothetical protein